MRDLFKKYNLPQDSEWEAIWDECMFVVDTNVLLNLYRYDKSTSDDLLSVLNKIADRLWIPYQVALEYHENLDKVIIERLNQYKVVDDSLNSEKSNLEKLKEEHYSIDPSRVIDDLVDAIGKFHEEVRELRSQQSEHYDNLSIQLQELLHDKIGEPPTNQEELDRLYGHAEERFEIEMPPGFKDNSKQKDSSNEFFHNNLLYQRQYGDVILWLQIIAEAEVSERKNVIFITDDRKEDWWRIIKGQKKGPRYELIDEISTKAGVKLFHMYNSECFLAFSKQRLDIDVKDESIEQVKEVTRKQSEKQELYRRTEDLVLDLRLYKLGRDQTYRDNIFFEITGAPNSWTRSFGLVLINATESTIAKGIQIRLAFSWRGHGIMHSPSLQAPSTQGWKTQANLIVAEQEAIWTFQDLEISCLHGLPIEWDGARLVVQEKMEGYILIHYTVSSIEPFTQNSGELRIYLGEDYG